MFAGLASLRSGVATATLILGLQVLPALALDRVDITVAGADPDLTEAVEGASLVRSLQAQDQDNPQDLLAAARADYGRILAALYARGHYSGVIQIQIDGREAASIAPLDTPSAIRAISIRVDPGPPFRFGTAKVIADALKVPAAKRTPEQQAALTAHFQAQFKDLQNQKKGLAAAKKPLPVDPQLIALETSHTEAQKPIVIDPKLVQLRRDADLSAKQLGNKRLTAAQDLAWALINSPAFLFNH